jgi:hypothetical protein
VKKQTLLPVLVVSLAACADAPPPPPLAPPAGGPAAPVAVAPGGLSPTLEEALGRVHGLFVDANEPAIRATFSPGFLSKIPVAQVQTIFAGVKAQLGACPTHKASLVQTDVAALVRVQCARGALDANIVVNPGPGHLVDALLLKPAM